MLTSHPDLDRAGDAMVDELRVMLKERDSLERQLREEQEQKEGMMITVAVSYIRLVLANWRRPLYQRHLAVSLKESSEFEGEIEEWERNQVTFFFFEEWERKQATILIFWK